MSIFIESQGLAVDLETISFEEEFLYRIKNLSQLQKDLEVVDNNPVAFIGRSIIDLAYQLWSFSDGNNPEKNSEVLNDKIRAFFLHTQILERFEFSYQVNFYEVIVASIFIQELGTKDGLDRSLTWAITSVYNTLFLSDFSVTKEDYKKYQNQSKAYQETGKALAEVYLRLDLYPEFIEHKEAKGWIEHMFKPKYLAYRRGEFFKEKGVIPQLLANEFLTKEVPKLASQFGY